MVEEPSWGFAIGPPPEAVAVLLPLIRAGHGAGIGAALRGRTEYRLAE